MSDHHPLDHGGTEATLERVRLFEMARADVPDSTKPTLDAHAAIRRFEFSAESRADTGRPRTERADQDHDYRPL